MEASAQDQAANDLLSFFITSVGPGDGANLGGLDGADRHGQMLADAAGYKNKTWHAYLSAHATDGMASVNARDRIGVGPWYNAKGVLIANTVDELHSESANLNKKASLNENGNPVNGRGDSSNTHDILTGSNPDGTLFVGGR